MLCPACGHESSAASFGDPLRCPDCGADYQKALLYKERIAPAHPALSMAGPEPLSSVADADIPKYIKASLSEGEVVVAIFSVPWLIRARFWLLLLLAILSVGILFFLPLIAWLQIRALEQGLTNKRVIIKRGIISRRTEEMKLTSIETVELIQGIGGRMLGYGDVRVTGRGISDVEFRFINDPLWVKRQIEGVGHPVS